jgi:ribose 5-phosphate isomerase B
MRKQLIHAERIRQAAAAKGELVLQKGRAILTDEARDLAHRLKVKLIWTIPSHEDVATVEPTSRSSHTLCSDGPRAQVVLGADHGGYAMKEAVKLGLKKQGFVVHDLGTYSEDAVDYPDYALEVAKWVSTGKASRGIMIDSIGIASAMVCNKVPGIRAAACEHPDVAISSRRHNNANVLTLGGKRLPEDQALQLCLTWLQEPYEGGRHQARVDKMMALD